jgi:two-component system OmpR family response regulator
MKILVVEDDEKLAGLIKRGLASVGHAVDVEHDGQAGEWAGLSGAYDAVVLDVMLPKKDGMAVLRALRGAGMPTPVLILTARDESADVVAGLDSGVDDYLRKPFALDELYARIRSLARRAAAPPCMVLKAGNLVLDTATQRAVRGDRELSLTAKELMYLEYFMRNAGRVITRVMLQNALWGSDRDVSSNVIDVYIARLRSKIEFDDMPPILNTVRGIGYRLG